MERLTFTDLELEANGHDCTVKIFDKTVGKFCDKVCEEFQYNCPFDKLGRKLKAYEDTGLTPEQILAMDEEYTKLAKELWEYKRLEEKGRLIKLPQSDWNHLIKQLATIIENDFIIYSDEREFIVNQIFFLEYYEEFRFSATCRCFNGDENDWWCDEECKYGEDGNFCYINFSFSDIGKTVFLTKEEAEKALEEMGE